MKGAQARPLARDIGPDQGFSLGKVTEVRDGVPVAVEIAGRTLAVAGTVTPAPGIRLPFQVGASVMVLHTEAGAFVQGAVHMNGERAKVEIGMDEHEALVIHARGGVVLKSDEATIELLADGAIRVSANRVFSVSKGPMTLRGSVIELN